MKFTFTGDFASLEKFANRVSRAPDVLDTVGQQLAEESLELVRSGFEDETDPYGEPWKPLVLRRGKTLADSGGLKASWHRREANRHGFSIASAKAYAKYHQGGTGIYGPRGQPIKSIKAKALKLPGGIFRKSVKGSPIRKMVPEGANVPPLWMDRFRETAFEVLTEHFKRGRKKR